MPLSVLSKTQYYSNKIHIPVRMIVDIGKPRTGILPEVSDEGIVPVQRMSVSTITLPDNWYLLY